MDKPILYHEVVPENNVNSANGFQEFNSIDFVLDAPQRALKANTIRLDFDLQVFSDLPAGTRVVQTSKIGYEPRIGGHAFFSNWRTSLPQSSGLVETITEYGRWVNMITSASMSEESFFSSHYVAEGRALLVEGGRAGTQAVNPRVQARAGANPAGSQDDLDGKATDANYSIKPLICVNRSMGGLYSFSKNGQVRISVDCARIGEALFGGDLEANANAGYKLRNVRMRFVSVPDDQQQPKMLMNTIVAVKSAVNSTFANISSKVPLQNCNGVAISVLEQSKEVGRLENSYALEKYPKLKSVQYLFSDATNKFITYRLTDLDEIEARGLEALSDNGINASSANMRKANKATIMGLGFQQYLDLSRQKFSVQLTSESTNLGGAPRNVYLFFMGLLEL